MKKRGVWMRVPVFIISGAILYVWGFFTLIFSLVQLILLLLGEKKENELLNISSRFSSQVYCFFKYVSFISEEKPFPFGERKEEEEK